MCKSRGNVDLILGTRGKQYRGPFSKLRRSHTDIDSYIENFSFDDAAQFRLRVVRLIMKSAQRAFDRARMIILHEWIDNAGLGEFFPMVSLQKESPRIP